MLGVRTLQFRHLGLTQPGRLQQSLADHRRLLVAYEEGDKMTAVSMTRSLIASGYQTIIRSGYFDASA
jgi:DNA-binding GntR family transcriptional regulator